MSNLTQRKSTFPPNPAGNGKHDARSEELNPRTTHYEFMGTPGALFVMLGCPAVLYGFAYFCNADGCPNLASLPSVQVEKLFDPTAALIYLGFLAYLTVLYFVLPGPWIPGTLLRDGSRLHYKINAFKTLIATLLTTLALFYQYGTTPFIIVTEHFLGLITTATLFSAVFSLYLYVRSFGKGRLLALGGNTGNFLYDYFIGRELNPRIGDFDLKYLIELRPGLIGWMLLNICFAAKQYQELGGRITNSMMLVLFFQSWYIVDAVLNEPAVLTTMDIIQDGFGYMLAFGNLAWVPLSYSLQARYLSHFPRDLSLIEVAAILTVQFGGYYIFRGSNGQKNAFRTNPDSLSVKHLKYIETKTGSKLLISGWWGVARHINYLGDLLMALAWSLPCGFSTPIPYFYPVYMTVLLVHRDRRDDEKCRNKYGKDWERYCQLVKYRILPGVY
ncbi:uncharacterized protein VTP21DRAFT_5424 [Calcarisporiella thermophila]|uniref:uncharacterized protein n=1 Tax=Calcarisporiella thermophila TaxID=911321 RepID=UPI00374242D7